jgi:hypothetical protein
MKFKLLVPGITGMSLLVSAGNIAAPNFTTSAFTPKYYFDPGGSDEA